MQEEAYVSADETYGEVIAEKDNPKEGKMSSDTELKESEFYSIKGH